MPSLVPTHRNHEDCSRVLRPRANGGFITRPLRSGDIPCPSPRPWVMTTAAGRLFQARGPSVLRDGRRGDGHSPGVGPARNDPDDPILPETTDHPTGTAAPA